MSTPMRENDPMRHSGARWCETHGRWECSKRTKAGADCHEVAIAGQAVGRMHAGKSSSVAKAQGQANLLAWSLLADESGTPRLDPVEVVLRALRVSVMRAELWAERLRAQVEEHDGNTGLVGLTHAAGRDGARVETGETIRSLAKLEAEERDRVVRYAKVAHDMGVDERRLELEQAQAGQVVTAVGVGLDAAELTGEQRDRFLEAFLGALGRSVDLADAEAVEA